jgi:hypothetical protein
MYKVERTTGLREENHKRKKNFGREGMGIKMKSEKGRKKKRKTATENFPAPSI